MPRPCHAQHPPSPETCHLCWCLALPGEQGAKYRRKWGEDAGLATMEIPESKPAAARLGWRYGVTTVPQRRRDLLPRTLASLRGAGFGTPRLFVDGDGDADAPSWSAEFDLPVTCRWPKVGTAASWHLAALELYHREPAADRYAIFQDDMVCSKNLLAYLEAVKYPTKGYQNLYTFPSNQTLSKGVGWFPSNQLGRGAVALVFDREAMTALLGDSHLVLRAQNPHRGHKAIDGGIVESMKRLGFTEYVHDPSLVQHTGDASVMGNNPHPKSPSFRGEDFDLLCLLAPPPQAGGGLGDMVSRALSIAGVTEEKVKAWVGGDCGCKERRERLNALGAFARRVLSGMTDRAREHLDAIMGGG